MIRINRPNKHKSTSTATSIGLEVWATRYGVSMRVVKRSSDGRIVDHMSVKQLAKVQDILEKGQVNG